MTASTAPLSAAGRELPKRWLAIIATIWGGQAASMITSYAAGYAVVWYITETTGSAIMLAAAAICAYLPQGLLSPFGGVIADKHNRKTVMIVADLSVGIVSLGLGIVILFGQVSFPLLMILVIVRSIGQAFHGPAMMAAMPLLVPEKHLLRINTLDQLLMSVASIGAPAFGIFLYTTIGFHSWPWRGLRWRRSPPSPTRPPRTSMCWRTFATAGKRCRQPVGSSCSSPASPSA